MPVDETSNGMQVSDNSSSDSDGLHTLLNVVISQLAPSNAVPMQSHVKLESNLTPSTLKPWTHVLLFGPFAGTEISCRTTVNWIVSTSACDPPASTAYMLVVWVVLVAGERNDGLPKTSPVTGSMKNEGGAPSMVNVTVPVASRTSVALMGGSKTGTSA